LHQLATQTTQDILEEEAVIKLAQKDPAHFKSLYEKYYKTIFLFVFHKLNNKETSADLTSQVFLNALVNIQKYKPMSVPFSAWLYRIAVNEINGYFRKNNKSRHVIIDDEMLKLIKEESEGPQIEELQLNIESVIKTLPISEVELIELRFFEKKSYAEIAFITGNTETNAKTKMWRILEKIRKNIVLTR
jgi:RNA polymerase sigma-70 factor (ECF subfamily)